MYIIFHHLSVYNPVIDDHFNKSLIFRQRRISASQLLAHKADNICDAETPPAATANFSFLQLQNGRRHFENVCL